MRVLAYFDYSADYIIFRCTAMMFGDKNISTDSKKFFKGD